MRNVLRVLVQMLSALRAVLEVRNALRGALPHLVHLRGIVIGPGRAGTRGAPAEPSLPALRWVSSPLHRPAPGAASRRRRVCAGITPTGPGPKGSGMFARELARRIVLHFLERLMQDRVVRW